MAVVAVASAEPAVAIVVLALVLAAVVLLDAAEWAHGAANGGAAVIGAVVKTGVAAT